MALATVYSQSRDAGGYIIRQGNALQFTPINHYFTLTEGAGSPTSVVVPNSSSANAYVAEIRLGNLGTNGAVFLLPAASPTLTLPNGTAALTLATIVPQDGLRCVVVAGQTLQFLYTSAGDSDVIDVSISYYANSASRFLGGPNG